MFSLGKSLRVFNTSCEIVFKDFYKNNTKSCLYFKHDRGQKKNYNSVFHSAFQMRIPMLVVEMHYCTLTY